MQQIRSLACSRGFQNYSPCASHCACFQQCPHSCLGNERGAECSWPLGKCLKEANSSHRDAQVRQVAGPSPYHSAEEQHLASSYFWLLQWVPMPGWVGSEGFFGRLTEPTSVPVNKVPLVFIWHNCIHRKEIASCTSWDKLGHLLPLCFIKSCAPHKVFGKITLCQVQVCAASWTWPCWWCTEAGSQCGLPAAAGCTSYK